MKRKRKEPKRKPGPREQPLEQGAYWDGEADKWHYSLITAYGLGLGENVYLLKWKARKIILALKGRKPLTEIAAEFRLKDWWAEGPSPGQRGKLWHEKIDAAKAKCRRDAGLLMDAKLDPVKFCKERIKDIDRARHKEELDGVGYDVRLVLGILPPEDVTPIVEAGKARRQEISGGTEIPE